MKFAGEALGLMCVFAALAVFVMLMIAASLCWKMLTLPMRILQWALQR